MTTENLTVEEPTMQELVVWLAEQKWSDFAQDLVRTWNSRGFLSMKQELAARSMRTKCLARDAAKAAPAPASSINPSEVPLGVHRIDGNIIKVYRTQSRRISTKILRERVNADGIYWEFEYLGYRGLKDLNADTLLPFDDARKFGRLTSRCINCLLALSDERSIAAGYGATCAKNHGWPYPNMKEAMKMLEDEGLDINEMLARVS